MSIGSSWFVLIFSFPHVRFRRWKEISVWRKLRMDVFSPPQNRNFCYNSPVPHERVTTIFDIGGRQIAPATGLKPKAGSRVPRDRACGGRQNLGILGKRVSCPFRSQSRGAGKARKAPSTLRNSVLGFVVKPLTFHSEKPNTMARRVVNPRGVPSSVFFVKVLRGTYHETWFRGCAAFLSRRSGGIQIRLVRE